MSTSLLPSTVTSVVPLTPRTKQLLLRVDNHSFGHIPGQHLSVRLDTDNGPTFRPYSPVSLPGTDTVALAVKRYDRGICSTWLHERTPGDSIRLTPPSGTLQVQDWDRDVLFLATGTGLTPLLAMLSAYLESGTGRAALMFGERTQQDLMYRDTLDRLSASYEDLSVTYVLSDEDWTGRTGYVQDHLDPALSTLDAPHSYVCGVPEMVVDTKDRLRAEGIPSEDIFSEGWEDGAVDD